MAESPINVTGTGQISGADEPRVATAAPDLLARGARGGRGGRRIDTQSLGQPAIEPIGELGDPRRLPRCHVDLPGGVRCQVEQLDLTGLDEAAARGWVVLSMKKDWNRIFSRP